MKRSVYLLLVCLLGYTCQRESMSSLTPEKLNQIVSQEINDYNQKMYFNIEDSLDISVKKEINSSLNDYIQSKDIARIKLLQNKGNVLSEKKRLFYQANLIDQLLKIKTHDQHTVQLLNNSLDDVLKSDFNYVKALSSTETYAHFIFNLDKNPKLKKAYLEKFTDSLDKYGDTAKKSSDYMAYYDELAKQQKKNPELKISDYQLHSLTKQCRLIQNGFENFWDNYLFCLGLHPAFDPTRDWDWRDNNWYTDRLIPTPFLNVNNTGIDVTLDNCSPDDGWCLFKRRIMNTDGENSVEDTCMQLYPAQKYFSLYNKYTGVMRTFIFHEQPNMNSGDYFRIVMEISDGDENNSYPHHGYFNIAGPVSYSNQEVTSLTANQVEFYCKYIDRGWLVVDLPLSFYKIYGDGAYFLNYFVYSVDKASINLEGTFEIESQQFVADNTSFFTSLSSAVDNLKHISNIKNNINSAGNEIKGTGMKLQGGSNDQLGDMLVSVGTAMMTGSTPLGVILGGTQLISSLFNFGGPSLKYSYQKGTINLSGTISNSADEGFVSILIQPNFKVNKAEFPLFYKKNLGTALGLFKLLELPPIEVLRDSYEHQTLGSPTRTYALGVRFLDELRITTNNRINAVLKNYTIQPVIKRKTLDDLNLTCGEYSNFNNAFIRHPDPLDPENYVLIFIPEFKYRSYYNFEEIYHCVRIKVDDYFKMDQSMASDAYLRVNYNFEITKDSGEVQEIELYTTYISKFKYSYYDWVSGHIWD